MRGIILFIVAKLLILAIYPIGFCYSLVLTFLKSGWRNLDKYLFRCALADDQSGNVYMAKLFNDVLIKPGGAHFGDPDETISSVLGKNQLAGKLTLTGRILNKILNLIEKDHSIKSIGE